MREEGYGGTPGGAHRFIYCGLQAIVTTKAWRLVNNGGSGPEGERRQKLKHGSIVTTFAHARSMRDVRLSKCQTSLALCQQRGQRAQARKKVKLKHGFKVTTNPHAHGIRDVRLSQCQLRHGLTRGAAQNNHETALFRHIGDGVVQGPEALQFARFARVGARGRRRRRRRSQQNKKQAVCAISRLGKNKKESAEQDASAQC